MKVWWSIVHRGVVGLFSLLDAENKRAV
jgi:hypothetical protein